MIHFLAPSGLLPLLPHLTLFHRVIFVYADGCVLVDDYCFLQASTHKA